MGAEDNIKFPTLEVRNPNELRRGPIQVGHGTQTCLMADFIYRTPSSLRGLSTRSPLLKLRRRSRRSTWS